MDLAPIIAAAAALIGALGTQALTARRELRTKRLELVFQRKADAYERVFEAIGPFAMAPADESKYQVFLAALDRATLFASEEVLETLTGRQGLNVCAQQLRIFAHEGSGNPFGQETHFFDASRAATRAMRLDLDAFSAGRW